MPNETYISLPYDTPSVFKDKYVGKRVLIIGTGHSTKQLVKHRDKIRKKFDVVIGLNFATKDFEEQLDFHMILEKNPTQSYESMKTQPYRRDLPRILNWKSLRLFPEDICIIKATRHSFGGKPDIKKYEHAGEEGLLIGPLGNKNLSVGSVALNALHFACIIGCDDIYMVGADLMFKDEYDHYYPDHLYRKSTTKIKNRSPIIEVQHDGKAYKTTKFFQESAQYIDHVIDTMCRPNNIRVYDFSGGLISAAIQVDLEEFMK
jgi:hypothetical protein